MPPAAPLRHRLRTLGLSLEHAVKQHRWLWRYAHCRRVADHWRMRHHGAESPRAAKRCLLDLRAIASDGEQGRRFHALVQLLSRGGYGLSLVPHLSFLQTGHREFKSRALDQIRPFGRSGDGTTFDLCLRDRRGPHPSAQRTIEVVTATSTPLRSDDVAMPYSFYPDIWDRNEDHRFEAYRNQKRLWRLFFGGHRSKMSYARIRKYPWLQPIDRDEVVRETLAYFSDSTRQIDSYDRLASALQTRHESFVMIDNGRFRTEAKDWLKLLANADFFLAAPGCDYPLSHNAIESISVGTIPVLEYDTLFTPALQDGENCISYRGVDGLREALARIEAMPRWRIDQLRQRVVDYYESHLSPAAFCNRLEQASTRRLHLFSYLTPSAAGPFSPAMASSPAAPKRRAA